MIRTFIRISLPHFAEHKLRTVLTALGIALGIAAGLGLQMTFQPIHESLRKSAQRMAGRAVIRVANGEAGVPEELLDEIRNVPGVDVAAASIQGSVAVVNRRGEQLYIFGVDLLEDQKIRDYQFSDDAKSGDGATLADPLVFMAKADAVALSADFLKVLNAKIGDQIDVRTAEGLKRLTIRGSMNSNNGPASLFGGRIALMDIFAAQKLLGFDHRFGQIDVSVKNGVAIDAVQAAIAKVANGRGLTTRENRNLDAVKFTIQMTENALFGANQVAMLLAMYIVFNTMLIAVAQRRREIGILRAAGAQRRTVIGLALMEAAGYAVLGSPVGIVIGILLAKFFSIYFLPMLGSAYAPTTPPAVTLHWNQALIALASGLIAAPLAALIPALEAAKVHPLEALRRSPSLNPSYTRIYRRLAVAGIVALVIGEYVAFFPPDAQRLFGNDRGGLMSFQFSLSYAAQFIAVCLVAPLLMLLAAKAIEPLLGRAFAALGSLASRSIASNMRRFSLTGTAFVVSVMEAVFMAGIWSTTTWRGGQIAGAMLGDTDVVVMSSPTFDKRGGKQLPGSVADQMAQVPGVAAVGSIRIADRPSAWREGAIIAVDPLPGRPGFVLIDGDKRRVLTEFARGRGIVVDQAFANMHSLRIGDGFSFPTPTGELHLPILGLAEITPSLAGGADRVYISRSVFRQYWRDDSVNIIGLVLAPGAAHDSVMDQIRSRFGADYPIFVSSAAVFRSSVERSLQREEAPLIPIFTFATVTALFGLVNSLLASIVDRTREIGTLRSVGTTRSQVGRMVLYEAVALAIVGTLLAIPAGFSVNYLNQLQNLVFDGSYFPFKPPGLLFLGSMFIAITALAALAGYLPGRRAAGVTITEAIQTE